MQRLILSVLLSAFCVSLYAGIDSRWTDEEIRSANTAATCPFLSQVERDVILYNNLARMYPKKFVQVELKDEPDNSYLRSLIATMNNMVPVNALTVNDRETELAKCWAKVSGQKGITGHDRVDCEPFYIGGYGAENCSYGRNTGRNIIVQLLIDKNTPSLGHRINCLNSIYVSVGVGFDKHITYGCCCVMDFTNQEGVAYPPAAGTSYSGTSYRKPSGSDKQKPNKQNDSNIYDRYFDYSGFSSISYLTLGYTYSFMDNRHWLNASLFDFRITAVGLSLLSMEMSVSPWDTRVFYRPTARIYVPVIDYLAIVPYGGVSMDTGAVGKLLNPNSTYNPQQDFTMAVIAGAGVNLSILKRMPIELKVEYRHPVINPTACLCPQGIYLGAQLYFGSTF